MARHLVRRASVTSLFSPLRAKHRVQGPVVRVMQRGTHSLLLTAAGALIVLAVLVTDPVGSRS